MSKKSRIVLQAVKPSYAIGAKYRAVLAKMLKLMLQDIIDNVLDNYEKNDKITFDADPFNINRIIANRIEGWKNYFNLRAEPYSKAFINEVDNDVTRQLKKVFLKANIEKLAIGLSQPNKIALQSSQALIEFNTSLIKSIPEELHTDVTRLVNEAIYGGKGKTWLAEKLQSTSQITKNRALFVSRDQLRKATSAIDNARRLGIGIVKAIWRHSKGDKQPRKSHLAANGKEYNLKRGCYIDGKWIQVGEEINCTCYSESVIELD